MSGRGEGGDGPEKRVRLDSIKDVSESHGTSSPGGGGIGADDYQLKARAIRANIDGQCRPFSEEDAEYNAARLDLNDRIMKQRSDWDELNERISRAETEREELVVRRADYKRRYQEFLESIKPFEEWEDRERQSLSAVLEADDRFKNALEKGTG